MKALNLSLCSAILSFAAAAPAFAADPWTGTWKEDVSKDKSNTVVTYTAKGDGFQFSNGSTIQYDFTCNGKVYPTYSTQTIKCTVASDGSIDWTTMVAGKVVDEQHRTFSADGKTMVMVETLHLDDGTTSKETLTRTRKSGTTGLAGEWVNSKLAESDPDIMTISVKDGVYHFQHAHEASYLDIKLDGTETAPKGKNVPPGEMVSYKAATANKVVTLAKLNGKVMSEGTMTLNADGKTMAVEFGLPGKATRNIIVYIKQ